MEWQKINYNIQPIENFDVHRICKSLFWITFKWTIQKWPKIIFQNKNMMNNSFEGDTNFRPLVVAEKPMC